jgi:hypothetical protein
LDTIEPDLQKDGTSRAPLTRTFRSFRAIFISGGVELLALPAHRPNLNAYAERWVRSVKEKCLSKVL